MATMLLEQQTDSSAWKGATYYGANDWIRHWSNDALRQFDEALRLVKSRSLSVPNISMQDFPLFDVAAELDEIVDLLENGPGFVLIKGLPLDKYDDTDAAILYWGIGLYLGIPVSQNAKGDMLGHVRDTGKTREEGRPYERRNLLEYHTDHSDVVGLLCLRPAKQGGLSSLVSAPAVHNVILSERPDLLATLYEDDLYYHWKNEEPDGADPYYRSRVFSYYQGKLSMRYARGLIEEALLDFPELPRLTARQKEALDYLDSIMARDEMHLDMMFDRGDIQFVNNWVALHSRTAFEDFDEPKRKRHLLRLWLAMPNGRALAPEFHDRDKFLPPGLPRGSFHVRT